MCVCDIPCHPITHSSKRELSIREHVAHITLVDGNAAILRSSVGGAGIDEARQRWAAAN